MAVFRIEKSRDYTVMSNHHLKDKNLTLKSKGLLSMMLSLPDEWNYTTRGLAAICKEGVDSIGTALKELETIGYIKRYRLRDEKGKIKDTEYVIYEKPQTEPNEEQPNTALPHTEKPYTDFPYMDNPDTDKPCTENTAQLNTNISNTKKSNIDLSSMNISNPIQSNPKEKKDRNGMDEIHTYEKIIKANIEYDILIINNPLDKDRIDEIVELMTETVCTAREYLTIAGDDFPAELVKSKLLKLNSEHIEYVLSSIKNNTTQVRNIKKYLLATLFNAPSTIDSYYTSQVNHDLYGG